MGSLSSTFYEQLLHMQILKAQKKNDNLTVFFALSGSVCVKAAHRMLMKLTHGNGSNRGHLVGRGLVGLD